MPVIREHICFPLIIAMQRAMRHRQLPEQWLWWNNRSVINLHGDANITHQAGNASDVNASWSDAVDGRA